MIARCVWNYSNETQEEWSHIDALLLRTSRRTEGKSNDSFLLLHRQRNIHFALKTVFLLWDTLREDSDFVSCRKSLSLGLTETTLTATRSIVRDKSRFYLLSLYHTGLGSISAARFFILERIYRIILFLVHMNCELVSNFKWRKSTTSRGLLKASSISRYLDKKNTGHGFFSFFLNWICYTCVFYKVSPSFNNETAY